MTNPIYFIYDGECPICTLASRVFRVKQVTGEIITVNARESNHPLVLEVTSRNLNLDKGMVVIYGDRFYHGTEALHIMGLLSSNQGWFNRICASLFKYKWLAMFAYPFLKGVRNISLLFLGKSKIENVK